MRFGFTSVGAGLVASVIVHLMLLVVVAVPYQRPTAHGETMTVDLVSPEEAAPAFNDSIPSDDPKSEVPKASPPKPEAQPDFSKLQITPPAPNSDAPSDSALSQVQSNRQSVPRQPQRQAQSSPPPPAQAQQQQQIQPQRMEPPREEQAASAKPSETAPPEVQVEHPAEQGMRLAALLGLPSPVEASFGSEAEAKAELENKDMVALKAHLRKCWTLPPGVSENQRMKVIVRITLRRDGQLARDPEPIEGPASRVGFSLVKNALEAVKQCQPYTMLPADKYNEWRVLDLNFSPDRMAGG